MPACAGGISTRITWRSIALKSAAESSSCSSFIGIANDPVGIRLRAFPHFKATSPVMDPRFSREMREAAAARAERHSPFLRGLMKAHPGTLETFFADGAEQACADALDHGEADVQSRLRQQRQRLALAVALGDLSGELSFEQATRLLSDFADGAIDLALKTAIRERVPDADAAGFAVIAMGKLGSRELNYS